MSIGGVGGIAAYNGGHPQFTRSTVGSAVRVAPNAPVTINPGALNRGFVIIWAGKNNALASSQILSDIAAIVDSLPRPKRFVVLSVTNSNIPSQWRGGPTYEKYSSLDRSLEKAFPAHFLDIRSRLVGAFNQHLPEDVIDHDHDVIPSSLRFVSSSVLGRDIADVTSCSDVPAPQGDGSSVQIDEERIYVASAHAGFATEHGCSRGFAGTAAQRHTGGSPVLTFDATHLNTRGQAFVAGQISTWMQEHDQSPAPPGSLTNIGVAPLFASPPSIGTTTPAIMSASALAVGAKSGDAVPSAVVGSVRVLYGGSGYMSPPPVSFSNGGTGVAVLDGTSVVDVVVTSTGKPTSEPIEARFGGSPTEAAYAIVTPQRIALLAYGPTAALPNVVHTLYGSGACFVFASESGVRNVTMCGSGDGDFVKFFSKGKGGVALAGASALKFLTSEDSGTAQLRASSDGNSIQVDGSGGIVPADSSMQTLGSAERPWATTYTRGFVCSIATISSAYAVTTDDCTILCNASSADVVIRLPPVVGANVYTIKKVDRSAHRCVVDGGGHSIDGGPTNVISAPYKGSRIQGDRVQWWVLN